MHHAVGASAGAAWHGDPQSLRTWSWSLPSAELPSRFDEERAESGEEGTAAVGM
ncbi:hypothetical protein GZL_07887 [Streptomyces sp. 769]|nr:hypothetical protein GZL_07887 [Streptomyces sp. 769]